MRTAHCTSLNVVAALAVSIAASAATPAAAQGQNSLGSISNNNSIFIDGKTFEILGGRAKGDVAAQVKNLGARELGGGAIIFRSGDKLYILGGGAGAAAAFVPDEGPIHIEYEEPKDPNLKETYDLVKERRGLETFRELLSPFRLPEDLYIKA